MKKKIALALFVLLCAAIAWAIVQQYQKTEAKNNGIKFEIAKIEKELQAPPPPPRIIDRTVTREQRAQSADGKPVTLPPIVDTVREVDTTPIKEYEKNQQIKIELVGVLKLQINENNSWETIAKLLILILVSYGGIKLINRKLA